MHPISTMLKQCLLDIGKTYFTRYLHESVAYAKMKELVLPALQAPASYAAININHSDLESVIPVRYIIYWLFLKHHREYAICKLVRIDYVSQNVMIMSC